MSVAQAVLTDLKSEWNVLDVRKSLSKLMMKMNLVQDTRYRFHHGVKSAKISQPLSQIWQGPQLVVCAYRYTEPRRQPRMLQLHSQRSPSQSVKDIS